MCPSGVLNGFVIFSQFSYICLHLSDTQQGYCGFDFLSCFSIFAPTIRIKSCTLWQKNISKNRRKFAVGFDNGQYLW